MLCFAVDTFFLAVQQHHSISHHIIRAAVQQAQVRIIGKRGRFMGTSGGSREAGGLDVGCILSFAVDTFFVTAQHSDSEDTCSLVQCKNTFKSSARPTDNR